MAKPQPTAQRIRELVAEERFREIEPILKAGLASDPKDPALLAERARLSLYQAREKDCFDLLCTLDPNAQTRGIAQVLANHLRCLQLAKPKDAVAPAALAKLKSRFAVVPEAHVGLKITACLIVKDEESNLGRCLSSLNDLVDEIVVVDTGSKDKTVEIAKAHGAKIGYFEWCGDFSAARNASLELATGNWILWIDADEEIEASSKGVLRRAIERPQFGGFSVEIVNFTADGNDQSQYTHSPIRLFQNLPDVRFTGRIHEQICHGLKAHGLPGATLEGARILHYGYRPSEMEAKGKVQRTLELLQQEVLDHPEEAFHWFNFCNALFVAERWAEAEHAGRQCAKRLLPNDPYGALNYQLLVGALAAQNKLAVALKVCDQAEVKGFGGILIDFERANVHLRADQAAEALEAADRCMAGEWPEGTTGDRSIFFYKRHLVRGQALAMLGRFEEALAMFEHALSVVPGHAPALYCIGATFERLGQWPAAREMLLAARQDPVVGRLSTKAAARVSLRMGLAKEAVELFRATWEANTLDQDAWVGWVEAANIWGNPKEIVEAYEAFAKKNEPTVEILINWGRALQGIGQSEQALAMYSEALKREPENANAYFNCGDLLYALGQYSDAAHLYEAGLRHRPAHADGWFVLGNCFARMGMEDGAKLAFSQALQIDPQHTAAAHNLDCLAA